MGVRLTCDAEQCFAFGGASAVGLASKDLLVINTSSTTPEWRRLVEVRVTALKRAAKSTPACVRACVCAQNTTNNTVVHVVARVFVVDVSCPLRDL